MTACASSRSIARAAGAKPVAGRIAGRGLAVMQRVDHPDPAAANEQALEDLENGATGLTLVLAGSVGANGYGLDASPATIARVLDGVDLDAGITIDFNLSPADARRRAALRRARAKPEASRRPRSTCASASIRSAALRRHRQSPRPWTAIVARFAGMIARAGDQGFRGPFAVADGRIIHNAGGSEAQELAFAIASAVDYLRALEAGGIALDAARGMIYFRLAADADQFLTIAKFRALRKLWARVEEACGLAPKPAFVAAETAWRMMTQRDPYVNMLRTTIAVAAAGLGGADASCVLPFTAALGLPDAFARRVARNTQLILLEESNLAKVADPAAGSGGIEDLTDQALRRGLDAVPGDRKRRRRLGRARSRAHPERRSPPCAPSARRRSRARKDALTGTSEFPNLGEAPVAVLDVAPVDAAETRPPPITIDAAAAHPARRAVRSAARRLRPHAGEDRRAAESLPRQSRQARRTSPRARSSPRISSRPAASRR